MSVKQIGDENKDIHQLGCNVYRLIRALLKLCVARLHGRECEHIEAAILECDVGIGNVEWN